MNRATTKKPSQDSIQRPGRSNCIYRVYVRCSYLRDIAIIVYNLQLLNSFILKELGLFHSTLLEVHENDQHEVAGQTQGEEEVEWSRVGVFCVRDIVDDCA